MNTRLEGWKLALAVLIPTLIVGAAIFFAIQALSGDDSTSVETAEPVAVPPTVTATALAETETFTAPTVVPSPTPLDLSSSPLTAAERPTATPLPTVAPTAVPTTAPAAPAPAAPAPAVPSQPAGPAPTATVDPNLVTVSCSGATFPLQVDVGEALPILEAVVTPPEQAASMQYQWTLGNGRIVGAVNSGTIIYDAPGGYTIVLQATDTVTGEVRSTTCGSVTVGAAAAAVTNVSCQVRPAVSGLKWVDATIDDVMRVRTTWKPANVPLTLQYEFDINDPIVFSNDATSPDTLDRSFTREGVIVGVFWRDEATGETGRVTCPAFSDEPSSTATPTVGTDVTPTVDPNLTATPTATATTPTPTATTATPTVTPTTAGST